MSIITGTPTAVHGISGNFYLDRQTGEPVPMTSEALLRAPTVLSGFASKGLRCAAVTSKDKLCRQLGKGLQPGKDGSIVFSAEKAAAATLDVNGIEHVPEWLGLPQPSVYSAELSLFVLEAGLKLVKEKRADVLYLSLSDYVQHAHAPEAEEAEAFYREMDRLFGEIDQTGAVLVLTADHGMRDKADQEGRPNILWLQDDVDAEFGPGRARVICPITDAYVAHHGALGGFVRIWVTEESGRDELVEKLLGFCAKLPGVEAAMTGGQAAELLEMPLDREGDIVVFADSHHVIGSAKSRHDLSGLHGKRLRTHGGLSESKVPLVMNRPLSEAARAEWAMRRIFNRSAFELAFNTGS